MNHTIQHDIEERDHMAELIQKAIDALEEVLKFDDEITEKNNWGSNTLGFMERPLIRRELADIKSSKETYIRKRKYEDDQWN